MLGFLKAFLHPGPITFRQLLLLSLPALVIGSLLRIIFFTVFPEGFFSGDSASYYEFSNQLFDHGVFELSEKRRWLYPIFLALLDALPFPAWYSVPLLQHLIGLITVVGIGWCSAQLTLHARCVVPVVTILAAIWPRMLWYEHEMKAESLLLAAFVFVIALLLTPGIARHRGGLILLMTAFALLAGMKGASRFLWAGSVVGLFVIQRDPRLWLWGRVSCFMAAVSMFFVITVGKASQADWLALSSSLPLVRSEGEPYSRYRNALKPQILEARTYGNDYPWKVYIYKKRLNKKDPNVVHPDWASLNRNRPLLSKVARSFWVEAVLGQPLRFAGMSTKTMAIALSDSTLYEKFDPPIFWSSLRERIYPRWHDKPRYFNRLFGMNQAAFDLRHDQASQRNFVLLPVIRWVDETLRWLSRVPAAGGSDSDSLFPTFRPRPLGVMACLGGFLGPLCSGKRLQCLVLLLPLMLYLFGTYAVGDAVPRYLQPVEWIGLVFAGVLLDLILQAASAVYALSRRWLSPLS